MTIDAKTTGPRERICVFCGSSPGARPAYTEAARATGRALVARGLGLVYGGGNVGLMGIVADAVLEGGGEVIGVIPDALAAKELAHHGVTELRVVDSMHTRKAMMAELSAGFVAMPGGIGTFEEFFEILTWGQLGLHAKPCGLLNVEGFYDGLLAMLDHAVAERFFKPKHRASVLVADEPDALLDLFADYRAPGGPKWIDRRST